MALYRLVQQHLESWLARRREDDCEGVPIQRHVERELRSCVRLSPAGSLRVE
jgi:hypothetical protein